MPVHAHEKNGQRPDKWWPNQLSLKPLAQGAPASVTNYAEKFNALDLEEVKRDIFNVMKTSQIGGLWTTVTTALSLFAWRGIVRGHIERLTGAEAPEQATCACTLEQLARQRQFGQSEAPVVADQKEVRKQNILGRLDGIRWKLCDRIDGLDSLGFGGGRVDAWEPEADITGALNRNGCS